MSKLCNTTEHSNDAINQLVQFVAQRIGTRLDFDLIVNQVEMYGVAGNGLAEEWKVGSITKFKVYIKLALHTSYPMWVLQEPAVGQVRLTSWKEEMVYLCAHELTHLVQFQKRVFTEASRSVMELEAETAAVRILVEYKREVVSECKDMAA